MATARDLWIRLETIHAVTYFAPESRNAARAAGLKGFWMGYFGFRAAPLGAVGPDVVASAFFNFAPRMVERAIPDAWRDASPDELITARRGAAAAALRRTAPAVDSVVDSVVAALAAASHAGPAGDRPLFAANRALPDPADPTESLWQQCTTLREHRGDAHVAALRAAGLDGCGAHVLLAADQQVPDALLRESRGWEAEEWDEARAALVELGLIARDRTITAAGRARRAEVEAATDAAGAEPFDGAIPGALLDALEPVARAVERSGVIPYPNPMGLPRLT